MLNAQSRGPENQQLAGASSSWYRGETHPAPWPGTQAGPNHPVAGPPAVVVRILRSAYSAPPDPRLESVLGAFRAHWLSLGRRRYPQLHDDLEDVIQNALIKLVSRDKLATLRDPARLEAWARSLFVRTVLDLLRESKRHTQQRTLLSSPDGHPTPEELASHRERLAIVARVTARLEIARSKFLEDLPAEEIARRYNLTPLAVSSRLKRARASLRQALDGTPARRGPRARGGRAQAIPSASQQPRPPKN
jgi:RNA polymerase sigma factor (sigma-70 family)